MNITIADVARIANVSKATVSAVLNNRPTVAPRTRQKVLDVIKKLNYRPSGVARSLSIKQTKTIGLVIKEIDNPYFAKIMKGVFDTCSDNGYTVLLGSSELSPQQELKSIETLTSQRADGLIISPLQDENMDFRYLSELIHQKYPLVTLGSVRNHVTNVVDIDNVAAAYQAVRYLIELGHTEIAYFAGPSYSAHSDDRRRGYQQALIDSDLPIRKNFIVPVGSYIENSYELGRDFFAGSDPLPSAVFCYNDLVAIGLIQALLELKIPVPEQVSVIGFDDIDFCRAVQVPLTTVHVPAYQLGRSAADLLIRQIQEPERLLNEKIILETRIVERGSCGAMR